MKRSAFFFLTLFALTTFPLEAEAGTWSWHSDRFDLNHILFVLGLTPDAT